MCSVGHEDQGNQCFPTLSIDYKSISMVLSQSISPYLCLPPPVGSVYFSIEVFRWRIAVEATQRGVNNMLGIDWLPHQASHAFDDLSTPVFDSALVIVMPSHILENVQLPHPKSQIIWHARHELLEAIPVFEASEMQSGVFFIQHLFILPLYAYLLDPTLDMIVLYMGCKRVVGVIL